MNQASPKIILDSGAFSVWTKGEVIDVEKYIEFCQAFPDCSYYIALDSIPGRFGDMATRTPDVINAAAELSWKNYERMCEVLPREKVMPVFHRGEPDIWLQRYVEASTYVGIGQITFFGSTDQAKKWLDHLSQYLFDGAGRPTVRTHGLAVTSFDIMNYQHWHSVDSASWCRGAAFGGVWVPWFDSNGKPRFDKSPETVNVTPTRIDTGASGGFIPAGKYASTFESKANMTRQRLEQVTEWLASHRLRLGEVDFVDVDPGYKKKKGESWASKERKQIIRCRVPGVMSDHRHRYAANIFYILEVEKHIDVNRIYFAGAEGSAPQSLEDAMYNRLMSYHSLGKDETKNTQAIRLFQSWCERSINV